MRVRIRRPLAPPPPPHLHRWHPDLCIPLRRTRRRSWGCHSRSSFISIIPSSASAASSPSSPSSKASISHKHPSTSELHTPPLSQISLGLIYSLSSPSGRSGLPLHHTPSPILIIIILSPSHRSRKSRQAVSSSHQSVF